ncbi:uncharacterized protein LOC108114000 [Drosophila eugracilis]|uniref:uncharacterized protein LOC108114000 n=1 Tax=Drosophila eugracilis TaxID=29029 RepID=UPI0007E6E1E4|nr:uncharacterized protein LOC108114000 [Drosophila eugracilis]
MCRLLVFILIVLFSGGSQSWSAREVIHQLNKDGKHQLNIYMDCGDTDLKMDQEVSNLLIESYKKPKKLMGRFSERSLTIACLEESTKNQTINGIQELLWGLHHLQMLFIVNSSNFYFQEALDKGFVRVLALNLLNGKLYTYRPYPKVNIHQIDDIKMFYSLTNLRNLQKQAVTLTVETMTPRCFHYTNRKGQKVYAGYMYQMIKQFIKTYNGTERHLLYDTDIIPYEEGLRALKSGEIDMVPRIIHTLGWKYFYHSHIFFNIKTYIMVPWAEPLAKSLYFIRPFGSAVWFTIIVSFIYASILIWWITHRQEENSTLSKTFLDVLQLLFQLPVTKIWHFNMGMHQVVSFIVLFTVGFILTNLYTAQLSSYLTTGLFKRQLNTFEDLFREKQMLMVESFDADVLRKMIKAKIIQKEFENITFVASIEDVFKYRKGLNKTYAYEAYEDRIAFELSQQMYLRVPIFKTLKEVFDQRPVFILVRHGLPYLELFNSYLKGIWESGIWGKLQRDATLEGISGGEISFRISKSREIQVFDKEFYFFAYILLGLGWFFGTVVFLLEKFMF